MFLGIGGGSCGIFDSDTVVEPALIVFYGDTSRIVAPDSVARGTTFEISVPTFAGGCTREIARTDQAVAGTVLEIRPYNVTQRAKVCTDDLLILTHTAMARIDQPGLATIRVRAKQRPPAGDAPAELERAITVY